MDARGQDGDLGVATGLENYAAGVSRDSLVVGNNITGGGLHGFAWSKAGGMVNLDPVGNPYAKWWALQQGVVFGVTYKPDSGHGTVWTIADGATPTSQR